MRKKKSIFVPDTIKCRRAKKTLLLVNTFEWPFVTSANRPAPITRIKMITLAR
jgi:hypothetical protein